MGDIDWHEKYSLLAEWFDLESFMRKKFYLFYYLADDTIELFDIKNHKTFLKRTTVEGIMKSDIYVGNTINIFSRPFSIIDYANAHTMKLMGIVTQKTCAIIKPEAMKKKGEILRRLTKEGFKVSKLKMLRLNTEIAAQFFKKYEQSRDYPSMVKALSRGPVLVMELLGDLAIGKLAELAGPNNPEEARASAPTSLRALYGVDKVFNGFHATSIGDKPSQEVEMLLERDLDNVNYESCTAVYNGSTLCLVKPHAIREGKLGDIIDMIEENGYTISAMKMVYMDIVNTEEFYEVYRGVVPEYPGMVSELISGASVAMEITSPLEDETAIQFRKFVGPTDPGIAKQLRPNTLRARFGETKLQNGIHVTDLPEDAMLEVEYFFKMID